MPLLPVCCALVIDAPSVAGRQDRAAAVAVGPLRPRRGHRVARGSRVRDTMMITLLQSVALASQTRSRFTRMMQPSHRVADQVIEAGPDEREPSLRIIRCVRRGFEFLKKGQ